MSERWAVPVQEAVRPLVLALDVGSTASRGALYDAHGRPAGERVKLPHAFTSASDGTSEIDPDQVLAELTEIIDRLVEQVGELPIGGVAPFG